MSGTSRSALRWTIVTRLCERCRRRPWRELVRGRKLCGRCARVENY